MMLARKDAETMRAGKAMQLPEKALIEELCRKASAMRERAYVPYSHFRVGAALLSASGRIYTGCNIENAAFTPGMCAERTAFSKAVSEGEKEFLAIAISGGPEEGPGQYCPPCGVCRQVMSEFCESDFPVFLTKDGTDYRTYTLEELLPFRFGPDNMR
jgi:cytidine deaminase